MQKIIVLLSLLIYSCGIGGPGKTGKQQDTLIKLTGAYFFTKDNSFRFVSIEPKDGSTNVKIDSKITIQFTSHAEQTFVTNNKYNDCTYTGTSGTKYTVNDGVTALSKDGYNTCVGLTSANNSSTSILTPSTTLEYSKSYKFTGHAYYPIKTCTKSSNGYETCKTDYKYIKITTAFTTEPPPSNQLFIKGTVLDAATGKALPVVQVSTNPPTVEVATDGSGNFSISQNITSVDYYKITFSKTGYKTKIISQKPSTYDSVYNQITMDVGTGIVDQSITTTTDGTTDGGTTGGGGDGGTGVDTTAVSVDTVQGIEEKPSGATVPPSSWDLYTPLKVGDTYYAIANASTVHSYKWDTDSQQWLQITVNKASYYGGYYQSAQICGNRLFIYGGASSNEARGYYQDITNISLNWLSPTLTDSLKVKDQQVPGAYMIIGRKKPLIVCIENGQKVLVFGGYYDKFYTGWNNNGYASFFDGKIYDFTKDAWSRTVSNINPPASRYHNQTILAGNNIIIWGGCSADYSAGNYKIADAYCSPSLNTGNIYNIPSNTWTPMSINANTPSGRAEFAMVWTGEKVIVWGGRYNTSGSTNYTYYQTGAIYNPSTNTWEKATSTAFAPSARSGNIIAKWTGTEMSITGGSYGTDYTDLSKKIYYYNPTTDSWRNEDL
jgi:hypothetical protein